MASPLPPITQIARDAAWLPHRYDADRDAVHFRHVPRAVHRQATFLTDEYLPADGVPVELRRAEVMAQTPSQAPLHFIFHSAFCCSTVLVRAFDIDGVAMGLKEPLILNDLCGWRLRGAERNRLAAVLGDTLALLARPFAPGEAVIVKPTNLFNGLAAVSLAMRPEARALLLHAPIEVFLKSIAKKGMTGRLWVRDLLVKQLKEGLIDLGFENADYLGMTDLQAAAVGWLAQQAVFASLVARYPDRVRTLDSETLLARPEATVAGLAGLYGLTVDAAAVAAGPAFGRHSKFGQVFDAAARAAEYAEADALHGDEIAKVAVWAAAVAKTGGVPMTLGAALI